MMAVTKMAPAEKTWAQLEKDIAETFRRWPNARAHTIHVPWEVNATNRRRAARPPATEAEKAVTLRFAWHRSEQRSGPDKAISITATSASTAVGNLERIAKAVELWRLSELRHLTALLTILDRQMHPEPRRKPAKASDPHAMLHITEDAPLEVAEAAYRALAMRAHPDAGGYHARMVALNAAIAAIRAKADAKP